VKYVAEQLSARNIAFLELRHEQHDLPDNIEVDTKNAAAAFYLRHGFIALPESPLMLFLSLETVHAYRKID